ncbi:hypothetical protein [Deinococcus sp.]|uniref:hypothetical protein n=1 Tax=Deinococcus sp. TaxID=47478 RepID=UPI003CC6B733
MSGQAVALLSALQAAGVHVALGAAGDTLELTGKRPPAALLDGVRASKAALLELLAPPKQQAAPVFEAKALAQQREAALSAVPALPAHLLALIEQAKAGQLPSGPVHLASGLCPDLGVYVLAWADCWPRDRAHVLRRLEEAHAALGFSSDSP